jgi:predicted dithiol-disulfide oxidoreductase (DUF899 family)
MVCLLGGESATVRSRLPRLREWTRPMFSRTCRSSTRSFDYVVRVAKHRGIDPFLNTYSFLDLMALGRQEKDDTTRWLRHHDKY